MFQTRKEDINDYLSERGCGTNYFRKKHKVYNTMKKCKSYNYS